MLKTSIAFVCAVLFLLHQSQEISLPPSGLKFSRDALDQRAILHRRSWWTWSSQDGYRSGSGDFPSNAYSQPSNQESYANPIAHNSSPSRDDSYYGGRNLTSGNTGGNVPTKQSEIKQWLDLHNHFRSQYGAAPLKWNPKLVQASKHLIDTCVWRHTQNNQYGENMSAGQSSIREVVEGWVNGPEEKDSYTGSNSAPSHFTQVVWLSTTEVGCYHSTCQNVRGANLPQSPVTFWACNYNPPGNVIGEFAQNVKARAGGTPV
uniref:SCP domain-containing protein n=1 Tax=Phakopsora pachyrhizi TaxID=170000 RepID=A0A0S1MJZ2_PHAPC